MRLKKQTPIGLHFNLADHSLKHLAIMGIEQLNSNSNTCSARRNKETTWQTILQTNHPFGINNLNTHLLQ